MEHNVLTANSQMAKIDEMRASMTPHERDTFNEALIAEARALIEKGDRMMEAESEHIRQQLGDVPDILSMSYIAKNYFGKSRTWLYQRLRKDAAAGGFA